MFSEFLSASTAAPFIVFMVKDFQAAIGEVDESTIAFWSAVVASCFFLAQFLTSLLWVSIAEKHGRRAVLFSSMCGNSITLILFGCSRNLRTAIAVRLGQGLFSGAIGVARGGVRTVTNRSNEGESLLHTTCFSGTDVRIVIRLRIHSHFHLLVCRRYNRKLYRRTDGTSCMLFYLKLICSETDA